MHQKKFDFPAGFGWGTATSAHQVEGGQANNDWAANEHRPGWVYQDQHAGQACNWWQAAEADFDRMVELGTNTHRLSIEWSRVEPQPGRFDDAAIERYRQMLAGLRSRGILPMVSLHHFTNPIWLAEQGGWANPKVINHFERYVRRAVAAFGEYTDLWCTINEPTVLLGHAHILGDWPPFAKDFGAALEMGLNFVKGHARAYQAIHQVQPQARVGLAHHLTSWQPWRTWLPNDHLATEFAQHLSNGALLQALSQGRMWVPLRGAVPLPQALNTLDWLGINYYQRFRIRFNILSPNTLFVQPKTHPKKFKGPGPWGEIHPRGFYLTLKHVWGRMQVPIYVTENGIPDETDLNRPRFLVSHLYQMWRAIQEGVPVHGYYFWSLVDNFEWSEGYNPLFRFGLYAVDFQTQERTLRESGALYAAVCKQGALSIDALQRYDPDLVQEMKLIPPALTGLPQAGQRV